MKTDCTLDRLDLRILTELQKRGRITNVELADAVGLSASPCLTRVKRLEKAGFIAGYGAMIRIEKLGDVQIVFTKITLADHRREDFVRFIGRLRLSAQVRHARRQPLPECDRRAAGARHRDREVLQLRDHQVANHQDALLSRDPLYCRIGLLQTTSPHKMALSRQPVGLVFGGDRRRIFVMAHSSGAHMAAMLASYPRYLAAQVMSNTSLSRMIGLAGPYAAIPTSDPHMDEIFPAALRQRALPTALVTGKEPRMLLAAGMADTDVVPRNSDPFADALRAHGDAVELKKYPGSGHDTIAESFSATQNTVSPVLADVTAFIDAH